MAVTVGYNSQFLVASQPSVAFTNEAMTSSDLTTYTITNAAKRYLDKNTPVVVQNSPDGTTWTTRTTGFTLYRCNARVVWNVAQASGTQTRLASGNYFPYAVLGEAASCEFQGKMETVEVTTFNSTGVKSFIPTLLTGTMKTKTFWLNNTRAASLLARDFIVVSFVTATNNRYEGFCYASDCNIKTDPKSAVDQELTFQLTDEFFNA
jgi:hypothetical protein